MMKMRALLTVGATAALVACGSPAEDPAIESDAGLEPIGEPTAAELETRTDLLVTAEWLAERLDDPDVIVLHVAPNAGRYNEGHIPGARFLPVSALLTESEGIAAELPPVEHLDSVFESLGVSDGQRVVVYGEPLPAARTFFTLDYLGHGDRTALLDGGLAAWTAADRPLSTESSTIEPGTFTPRPRDEIVVDADWVHARTDEADVVLLDARPEAQYTGEEAGDGVPRPGHIPGAANIYWEEMVVSSDRPELREIEELRAMFRDAGADPGATVVAYCRTGMQASFAYFVSRYLGYETVMYDGSFMDWSRRDDLPVEL